VNRLFQAVVNHINGYLGDPFEEDPEMVFMYYCGVKDLNDDNITGSGSTRTEPLLKVLKDNVRLARKPLKNFLENNPKLKVPSS
jgi:hypothetical protein